MNTAPWACLIRVSHMGSRRSSDESFHSERDQRAAIHRAVQRLGGEAVYLPAELNVSGGLTLTQRPALLAAVQGVEAGTYRGILVAYQSRLAREPRVEEEIHARVEAAGGSVQFATGSIDGATVDGRLQRRLLGAFNAAERERHVERFEELRESATRAGVWQRRQTPTGYRKGADRHLEPDDRAGDVRRAFHARAAGAPLVRVADALGMTPSGARQLLRNRVYLGELHVGRHANPAAHPAIVTVEEWEAAQVTVPRPPRSGVPVLLAGLVVCSGCGHRMSRSGATYACAVRHSRARCPEPAGITVRRLDEHVEAIALHALGQVSAASAQTTSAIEEARNAVAAARRELAAYLEAVSAADVGAEAFGLGARQRRDALEHALNTERRARPVAQVLGGDVVKAWDGLSVHERNVVLRGLLEVVVVRRVGRGGRTVAVSERVRVLAHGHGTRDSIGAPEVGLDVRPFWPDDGVEGVLRMPLGENAAPGAGG